MMIEGKEKVPTRFTGTHMLFALLAFFGVIVAVNLTMAVLASKSWTGLVVKNSYVASQHFNEELAAARMQHASGVRSELSYRDGVLVFSVLDKDGRRLNVTNVVAEIGRPVFEQADRRFDLSPLADQTYQLKIDLAPGVWFARLKAQTDGQPYRRDARIYVDDQRKVRVE